MAENQTKDGLPETVTNSSSEQLATSELRSSHLTGLYDCLRRSYDPRSDVDPNLNDSPPSENPLLGHALHNVLSVSPIVDLRGASGKALTSMANRWPATVAELVGRMDGAEPAQIQTATERLNAIGYGVIVLLASGMTKEQILEELKIRWVDEQAHKKLLNRS